MSRHPYTAWADRKRCRCRPIRAGSAEIMCHNQPEKAMCKRCVEKQQLLRLSFVLTSAVIGVITNAAIAWGNPEMATRCEAKALLGGRCSVECDEGIAYCTVGLFSSCCTCILNGYNACESIYKPSLPPETLSDAQDFVEWAAAYGTEGMARLSTLAQAVVHAYREGSDDEYATAENAFSTQFQSLSSEEQQAARRWAADLGY